MYQSCTSTYILHVLMLCVNAIMINAYNKLQNWITKSFINCEILTFNLQKSKFEIIMHQFLGWHTSCHGQQRNTFHYTQYMRSWFLDLPCGRRGWTTLPPAPPQRSRYPASPTASAVSGWWDRSVTVPHCDGRRGKPSLHRPPFSWQFLRESARDWLH